MNKGRSARVRASENFGRTVSTRKRGEGIVAVHASILYAHSRGRCNPAFDIFVDTKNFCINTSNVSW